MRSYYLSVIGGRRGFLPGLLRILLQAGAAVYAALHGTRRALYRAGLLRTVRFPCPVISVGNITVGGTGKTPLVEYLARWLGRRNIRTAILARGYGRIAGGGRSDDEDLISEMEIENVVRLTGRDRVAQGRRALSEFGAEAILLDDGFQHYRIARTLDIVTVDATNPFAGGHVLPRGLLREPPKALARAGLVVLTRTDQAAPEDLEALRSRLGPAVETVHKPVHIREVRTRKRHGIDALKGKSVVAFCGVGNPEAFRKTLEALGAFVVKFRAFADHHSYTLHDLRGLDAEAREFMVEAMATTEKDASRLEGAGFDIPLLVPHVEIEVVRHEKLLEERLLAALQAVSRAAAPIGR